MSITWLAFTPDTDAFSDVFFSWDKGNHLIAFFVLAILMDFSFLNHEWMNWLGLACYGIGIEYGQWILEYRNFELNDIIADLSGITLYIVVRPVNNRIPFLKKLRIEDIPNET